MSHPFLTIRFVVGVVLLICGAAPTALAAEHAGRVTFAGLPVPGATVTVSRGEQRVTTLTGEDGTYRFPDLPDGAWLIEVDMLGFSPARLDISVGLDTPPVTIALTLRSFAEILASGSTLAADRVVNSPAPQDQTDTSQTVPQSPGSPAPVTAPGTTADAGPDLASASSPFAQAGAFGNNRNLRRSLYNGTLGGVFGNSAWDSKPFSFVGGPGVPQSYNDMQFLATFGGPIPTPGSLAARPNLFVGYQRSIDNQAATQSAVVPTLAERLGDFSRAVDPSGVAVAIIDPLTGLPFPSGQIPADRLSPEARSLMALYPLPNLAGRFNYQAPTLTRVQQDSMQSRVTQNVNARNQLLGTLQYQRVQTDATSLLGLTSSTRTSSSDASAMWSRRFSPFFATRLRYQFTRQATGVSPHFAGVTDVIGEAGIAGADRVPDNWGPPLLTFASGLLSLSDVQYLDSSTNAHGIFGEALLNRQRHSLTVGGGVRRVNVDADGQLNGRGSFNFNGSTTGSDVADFALGLPGAATLALGNSDKRLYANAFEVFFTDDWRVTPGLTINAGVRWDYEGPFSEHLGRLSNLDLAPDFSAALVITPSAPVGGLTGRVYGSPLLESDFSGIQPRLGIAWRPVAGSSLVVRAGYGIYRNTNTYQSIALMMAQQPPYSRALSVETSQESPLTLQTGLLSPAQSPTTFAVDPDFRVGSAQNWQVLAQRDLPASLTFSAAYLGAYGRHLMQQFLPNTYPAGAPTACDSCPVGFAYLTSGGSSIRHAGQFQLRRRLRNGLQASAQYTLSKATDNAGAFTGAALSGAAIAQDWRDLEAEQGPSVFNQEHLFTAQVQYTTGVGVTGGGLLTGLKGALVKGWTFTSQMTTGSGFPMTAVYPGAVTGTGVTGTIRASRTGTSFDPPAGYYLNPDAFAPPEPGTWGDAGRNSITGPRQFAMSAGVLRTFPWGDRASLDWRIDASNVLNVVTYSALNTAVGTPQI
jgi:hypothetical protein